MAAPQLPLWHTLSSGFRSFFPSASESPKTICSCSWVWAFCSSTAVGGERVRGSAVAATADRAGLTRSLWNGLPGSPHVRALPGSGPLSRYRFLHHAPRGSPREAPSHQLGRSHWLCLLLSRAPGCCSSAASLRQTRAGEQGAMSPARSQVEGAAACRTVQRQTGQPGSDRHLGRHAVPLYPHAGEKAVPRACRIRLPRY